MIIGRFHRALPSRTRLFVFTLEVLPGFSLLPPAMPTSLIVPKSAHCLAAKVLCTQRPYSKKYTLFLTHLLAMKLFVVSGTSVLDSSGEDSIGLLATPTSQSEGMKLNHSAVPTAFKRKVVLTLARRLTGHIGVRRWSLGVVHIYGGPQKDHLYPEWLDWEVDHVA